MDAGDNEFVVVVLSVHVTALWLFEHRAGKTPARNGNSSLSFVPSLREALQNFSAVIVTGGSSGIGKSFIELLVKLNPALTICNLSRRKPGVNVPELKLRHFSCDLANAVEIERTVPELVAQLK